MVRLGVRTGSGESGGFGMALIRYSSVEETDHVVVASDDASAEAVALDILVEPDELGCALAVGELSLDVESSEGVFVDPADSPLGSMVDDPAATDPDDDRTLRIVRITWVFRIDGQVAEGVSPESFSEALRWIPYFYSGSEEVEVVSSTCVNFSESIVRV